MQLRNPKYGNAFITDTRVIIHDTLDKDVQVFSPSDKPAIYSFRAEFEALSDIDIERFMAFLDSAAGEVITITDHEGTNWTGVIKSDTIVFNEFQPCRWETGFEFEGSKA